MSNVTSKLIISAEDRTGRALSSAEKRIKRTERTINAFNRKQAAVDRAERMQAQAARSSAGGMMMGLGSGRLLAGLGGALAVSAVAGAIKDYAELERQMTRIGLAAGATADETKNATRDVSGLAQQFALPLDQAVSGLDALVATGMDMRQAMAFLPEVLKTAQASGAASDEMAASANSLSTSFKVSASEMGRAFDMLVTGGQLGQFELKDMARYLPTLTASAQKLGLTGLDGTKKLVAMLQTVRLVSGTSEEAAVAVRDAFEKMLSPTVGKALAKQGINIGKVLEGAAKRGENGFEAVIGELDKLTRGMSDTKRDLVLSSIFTEADSRRAVTALIKLRNEYRAYESQIADSAGAVDKNLKRVLDDTKASVDRLSNSYGNLKNAIGRAADAAGASKVMEGAANAITGALDGQQKQTEKLLAIEKALEGKTPWERAKILAAAGPEELDRLAAQGGWKGDPKDIIAKEEADRANLDAKIAEQDRIRREAQQARDNPLFPYVPGEAEKASKTLDDLLLRRAESDARRNWAMLDSGQNVVPEWMRTASPHWGNISDVRPAIPRPEPNPWRVIPLPPSDPRRGDAGASFWAPGGANLGDTLDIDSLRQAMEAGGSDISRGGTDAASAISQSGTNAGAAIRDAAQELRQAGRDAAAAISSAKPQMPAMGLGRAGYQRPNANLGVSMPDAGIAGGGGN